MKRVQLLILCLSAMFLSGPLVAAGHKKSDPASYNTKEDISYYEESVLKDASEYQREQCRLDVYHPTNRKDFPTIIWFHGGGLTKGKRYFPALKERGYALVAVSYRLSPEGELPSFIEDAAAATAWVLKNIEAFGGNPNKVFVAGHSAGGYLAAMVGMDPRWLAPYGIKPTQLAGVIPVSAQVTTHFLVRKLRGDQGHQYRPLIDEYAPLYYVDKDLPPICLIVGDRNIEWKSRVEENELLAVSLKNVGHTQTEFYEMGGLNHGAVAEGSALIIRRYVKRMCEGK